MLMDPALGRVIARWREGDRDAFEEVVDRYGLQLLRTARLILRDEALAEDAIQETKVSTGASIVKPTSAIRPAGGRSRVKSAGSNTMLKAKAIIMPRPAMVRSSATPI